MCSVQTQCHRLRPILMSQETHYHDGSVPRPFQLFGQGSLAENASSDSVQKVCGLWSSDRNSTGAWRDNTETVSLP